MIHSINMLIIKHICVYHNLNSGLFLFVFINLLSASKISASIVEEKIVINDDIPIHYYSE